MKPGIIFITGSDTGVGKTALAVLLTQFLRQRGRDVVALKPICSGGRADARALRAAAGNALTLDEVNPWHFRAPLAPMLAARMENRRVRLREVVAQVRRVAGRFETTVVEGAGGLLSPLGENFDSRDLLAALPARPLVVCANRLGAVNQTLLVLAALPPRLALRARVVLSHAGPDHSRAANVNLLAELIGRDRVLALPALAARRAPRLDQSWFDRLIG